MSSTALRHVGWCSGVAASAQQALREAAVAARDAGDSITDIAEVAGVTRQTIYRWIAQETGEAGGSPVAGGIVVDARPGHGAVGELGSGAGGVAAGSGGGAAAADVAAAGWCGGAGQTR